MTRTTGLLDILVCRADEDTRTRALAHMLDALNTDDLMEIAVRDDTPIDILERLAGMPQAKIRHSVALNLNCPTPLLETLSHDRAKTVTAAADRHLLWREISAPDAPIPTYTRERAQQLELLVRKDHPWRALPDLDRVLGQLLTDDAWINDTRFVAWCFDSAVDLTLHTAAQIGPGRLARALINALNGRGEYDSALHYLWEILPPEDFAAAIAENEDILSARLTRELGAAWKTAPLAAYDGHLPRGWVRVGLPSCPDSTLLEALDSDTEILIDLATANLRQRTHLHARIVAVLEREWHDEGYLRWELLRALSDDALLDLPVEAICESRTYGDEEAPIERARNALATHVNAIARKRPETWNLIRVIGDDYEGTGRELLAALRNL